MADQGVFEIYRGYPIIINGTTLTHSRAVEPNMGIQAMRVMADGATGAVAIAKAFQDSVVPFETANVNLVIGSGNMNVGIRKGKLCSSGATLQWEQRSGGDEVANDHFLAVSTKGFVSIQEISGDDAKNSPVILKGNYRLLRNATTGAYVVVSSGNALTGTPSLSTYYRLGPLYIDGNKIPGVKRFRLTTGIRDSAEGSDGATTGTIAKVEEDRLMLEVYLSNLKAFEDLFGFGTGQVANVAQFCRKVVAGGDSYADNTSNHIKLPFTSATYTVERIQGGGDVQGIVHFHEDTNAEIVPSIASTIP